MVNVPVLAIVVVVEGDNKRQGCRDEPTRWPFSVHVGALIYTVLAIQHEALHFNR